MSGLIACIVLVLASCSDRADPTPQEWVESLRRAACVEVDEYVVETHLGPAAESSGTLHEYARASYVPSGFTLQVWTPQQYQLGLWKSDVSVQLHGSAPPAHVVTLQGETVQEKIWVAEGGYQTFPAYQRLEPMNELRRAAIQRAVTEEVLKSPELASLSAEQRQEQIARRVNERMSELNRNPEEGVPETRARQGEPCLTGSLLAPHIGDSARLRSLDDKLARAVKSDPLQVNGECCETYLFQQSHFLELFCFSPSHGLVLWETRQFERGSTPALDSKPQVVRQRYFTWDIRASEASVSLTKEKKTE